MARTRDSQKSKVYSWGHALVRRPELKDEFLPTRVIQYAVNQMCEDFDVEAPEVRFSLRKKNWAHYYPGGHYITLPSLGKGGPTDGPNGESWAHNVEVIIHETSHAIHHVLLKKLCKSLPVNEARALRQSSYHADHGPAFMAINIWLLNEHTELSLTYLRESAQRRGIRIGNILDLIPQDQLDYAPTMAQAATKAPDDE